MAVDAALPLQQIDTHNIGSDHEFVDLRRQRDNIMGHQVRINGCRRRLHTADILILYGVIKA